MPCEFTINWSERIEYYNEKKDDVPKEQGVYEIQGYMSNENEYTRRYVGSTDNLRNRFLQHLSDNEPNEKIKNFLREKKPFFRFTKTDDESMSKDIEKGLYDKHKHTLNDPEHPPPGSGKCTKITISEKNP